MQTGIFGFPLNLQNQSSYWPYRNLAFHFKRELSTSGSLCIPPGVDEAVILLHGPGGGGGSYVSIGAEAGGGGGGAIIITKFKVQTGCRFSYVVGAKGIGGNPAGTNGGASTLSFYDSNGRLVATQSAGGGLGAPGNSGNQGGGGTYSETIYIETDRILIKAKNGNDGDPGAALGNDIGGYGGDTLIRAFDPLDTSRLRGIGSQVNNGATIDAQAIGSGGGGGVGSGIGSNGKDGCFWAVLIPSF